MSTQIVSPMILFVAMWSVAAKLLQSLHTKERMIIMPTIKGTT
jgi:hypothetical protein